MNTQSVSRNQRSRIEALDVKGHFYGYEVAGKIVPGDGYGVDSKTGTVRRLKPKVRRNRQPGKRGLLLAP